MNDALTILAAGDEFVRTDLLVGALREKLGDEPAIKELELPWPTTPWGSVEEVDEAAGDEDTMIAALDGIRAAVTHLAPFTERVLAHATDLKLVVVSRGGPVNVNLGAATEHGVAVCYAPGRNATAAAEFAIGLMLAACRSIAAGHQELASREWPGHYFRYESAGIELGGSTVGLVGYGAIGRRVAHVLQAFGAHVLVYDPMIDEAEDGVEAVRLDELLARSRVVSLHARLTKENRGMIGARELALMPTGAVLVNSARGGLLDHDALCEALESGQLGAAALDTYPAEPLPKDSRLFDAPRLVMTPHIAGCSREVAENAARICADEVGRWVAGQPLAALANPDVL